MLCKNRGDTLAANVEGDEVRALGVVVRNKRGFALPCSSGVFG